MEVPNSVYLCLLVRDPRVWAWASGWVMSFCQSVPGRKVTSVMIPELPSHWTVRQQRDCRRKAALEVRSHFNCVWNCARTLGICMAPIPGLFAVYTQETTVWLCDCLCLPISTHRSPALCGGSRNMMGAQRTPCACNISVPLPRKTRVIMVGSTVYKTPATVTEVTLIKHLKREALWGVFCCGQHQTHNMQRWRRTVSMGVLADY